MNKKDNASAPNILLERLLNGLFKENPTFVLLLGMCPTLAVTTSAINGLGMGLTTAVVLALSNLLISLLRKVIPNKIRIPAFIVIIASFVTIVELLLEAYIPFLYEALGLYIPLIVVNCIILGRAEAYAYSHPVLPSLFDGIGMGLGFSLALTIIGGVREIIGAGELFGVHIMPAGYVPVSIFVMAPGAFFVLAILTAIQNAIKDAGEKKGKDMSKIQSGCGGNCLDCDKDCKTDAVDKSNSKKADKKEEKKTAVKDIVKVFSKEKKAPEVKAVPNDNKEKEASKPAEDNKTSATAVSELKVEEASLTQAVSQTDAKPEAQTEVTAETKAEALTEAKVEAVPEVKAEVASEAKPEIQTKAANENKPESNAEEAVEDISAAKEAATDTASTQDKEDALLSDKEALLKDLEKDIAILSTEDKKEETSDNKVDDKDTKADTSALPNNDKKEKDSKKSGLLALFGKGKKENEDKPSKPIKEIKPAEEKDVEKSKANKEDKPFDEVENIVAVESTEAVMNNSEGEFPEEETIWLIEDEDGFEFIEIEDIKKEAPVSRKKPNRSANKAKAQELLMRAEKTVKEDKR